MPDRVPVTATTEPSQFRAPVAPAAVFLAAAVILTLAITGSFTANRGGVLYPLDDSYIHLALARTLAEHGVWGLTPSHPSAASSSPLWTVLLSIAALLTPGMSREAFSWVPLLGNVLAGVALTTVWRAWLRETPFPTWATLVLIAIVPLPAIAMIGMEHTLQILLSSLLAWKIAQVLQPERPVAFDELRTCAILCALAVSIRYESLALVAAGASYAVWVKRWSLIPALLAPAAAVIAVFGVIWTRDGGWIVPNSFLLKTDVARGAAEQGMAARLLTHALDSALTPIGLIMLALSAGVATMWICMRKQDRPERTLLALALASTGAQFLFGSFGWLFRYEAWLVALDALAILLAANALWPGRPRVFALVVGCLFVVCAPRAVQSIRHTVLAAGDRVWEHFGPADALAKLGDETILVNDIGVVSYYNAGEPIDVYGLANNDSLRLKREGKFDSDGVRRFADQQGASIGEFQICWNQMIGHLPAGWQVVEAWTGQRNVIFGDLTVAFMARDAEAAARLRAALGQADVPAGVTRFDARSPVLELYNGAKLEPQAALELCNKAALLSTGKPDPSIVAAERKPILTRLLELAHLQ
jgi:hypothetical protein